MKKAMGLMFVVGALLAMAVSASAASAAPTWRVGGVEVGGKANKVEVTTAGHLVFKGGGLEIGCNVKDKAFIWNEGGVGRDEITEFKIITAAPECETNIAGCKVTGATTTATAAAPWASLANLQAGVPFDEISGIGFTNTLAGCPVAEIVVAGAVNGEFDNATSSLKFTNTPGLTVTNLGGVPATVSGEDAITAPAEVELE